MALEELWEARRSGVDPGDLRSDTADEHFYLAIMARSVGDDGLALALARQAAQADPDRVLYAETARYLGSGVAWDVYGAPEAFTAFASGGGNARLYPAAHRALRRCYAGRSGIRLLDIGTGEGHGLLPALTSEIAEVDTVEPSMKRLELVTAELDRLGIPNRAHVTTVQEFATRPYVGPWDLVQETFALLTVPRADRVALFRWLRPLTERIALVEFDVPDLGSGLEPAWFRYTRDRYETGIREYAGAERDLVAQGFLVPVLLSTLCADDGQAHTEQPIGEWVADLAAAGFDVADPEPVHDYWWAPAYLVRAS